MRDAPGAGAAPPRSTGALPLDVQALFLAKNPRLARRLPPTAVRLLERLIHQRELREFVGSTDGCTGCEFVDRALDFLDVRVTSSGDELLPRDGRAVFAANHPTGGVDGLAMMHLLCRRYGTLRVPANDLLLALPPVGELLAAVDKYGSNRSRAASYEAMYASDAPVLVFPAGRTARFRGGELREFAWDKSFVKQARRHGRVIVPVHLSGRNSSRFYAIWRIRRALRIETNLEMLLLVDELFRRRRQTVRVRIGPPVDPGPPRGPRTDRMIAQKIRRFVEGDLARAAR